MKADIKWWVTVFSKECINIQFICQVYFRKDKIDTFLVFVIEYRMGCYRALEIIVRRKKGIYIIAGLKMTLEFQLGQLWMPAMSNGNETEQGVSRKS